MNIITSEVLTKLLRLVINQSRYQYSIELVPVSDDLYTFADTMTDEETEKFLTGKAIISDEKLERLAEKIGVEAIYDEDDWVDQVADYIIQNKDDCSELWAFIYSKALPSFK